VELRLSGAIQHCFCLAGGSSIGAFIGSWRKPRGNGGDGARRIDGASAGAAISLTESLVRGGFNYRFSW
jgi:hypothetical protein